MSCKKKILVYCDTHWAIGRIYRDVEIYLKNDFEFTYYDWANHNVEHIKSLIPNFDIFITNLVNIRFFIHDIHEIDLKKMIFSCHGYTELDHYKNFEFPEQYSYSIVSNSILELLPDNIKNNAFHTYNGVELSNFNYIKRSGILEKIGWCGASHVLWKRSSWAVEISTKTKLPLTFATNLPYDKLKEWYNKIDILLINPGPECWKETGPLPAFEAIASGVLVIGTKVGNFAEIPGPKYETIEEAVIIIEDLKKNPEKVKQISEQQYECVKQKWCYEVLSKQWKHMYDSVLQKINANFVIEI